MGKVLFIGIDGAPWKILNQFIEEGLVPNIAKLKGRGASGIMQSTNPPVTPVAWSTIQTGVSPHRHGLLYFQHFSPKTKEFSLTDASVLKVPTIHDLVSLEKKKVISINIPVTYPPKKTNGIIISGLLTPGSDSMYVSPSSLKPEIEKIGSFPYTTGTETFSDDRSVEGIVQNLRDIVKQRVKVSLHLMKTKPWDLFMYHFVSLDALFHPLYHYVDRDHELFDEDEYAKIIPFIKDIDTAIGKMMKEAKADYTMIISDHGFVSQDYTLYLNYFLKKKKYLSYEDNLGKNVLRKAVPVMGKILKTLGIKPPQKVGKKVVGASKVPVKWETAKAYNPGGGFESYIYVFDKSIEKKLIKDLYEIKNPFNGEKIVTKVWTKKELYPGKALIDNLPDLLVVTKPGYFMLTALTNRFIEKPKFGKTYFMGIHSPEGIHIMDGKNIPHNDAVHGHLRDVVPTLLHMLGVKQFKHLEGQVLEEVFCDTKNNAPRS